MRLQIYQVGEAVLRQQASPLTAEDIRSASIQKLIELMRETLRDVPGVGLAAPQIGQALQRLGIARGFGIWTACQGNRESLDSDNVRLAHTAGAIATNPSAAALAIS